MAAKKKRTVAKHACKNHPNRMTTRRCYNCKSYICSECIIKYDHHLFCSDDCIGQYKGLDKKTEKKVSYTSLSVFNKRDIIYLSLIIVLFFYIISVNRFKPADLPVSEDSLRKTITESWSPQIFQKEMVFRIMPAVPDTVAVAVWINGKFHKIVREANSVTIPARFLRSGDNRISFSLLKEDNQYTIFTTNILFNPSPYARLDYTRLPGRKKMIALTFDAGSNDGALDSVVNILRKYDIKATAFLTGKFIRKFPEDVQKLVNSGCFIFGNHSYSHPHLTDYEKTYKHHTLPNINMENLVRQLLRTDSVFSDLTGKHLQKLWRAPYGEYNNEILNWAGQLGYAHVGWSRGFDTFDWVVDTTSAIYYSSEGLWNKWKTRWEKEPERFRGAIVLMHLGNERIKPMYKFLHEFIPFMKKQGYEFVDLTVLKGH